VGLRDQARIFLANSAQMITDAPAYDGAPVADIGKYTVSSKQLGAAYTKRHMGPIDLVLHIRRHMLPRERLRTAHPWPTSANTR
jgi:hypothetical protein